MTGPCCVANNAGRGDMAGMNDEWHGCYDAGWQGEIVPEAFTHPAKFSRALIRRIYEHAFAEGWLAPGDVVADPFGGVALGALDAMWNGLTWVGCELEPRFIDLVAGMDCPGVTREQWKRFHAKPRGAFAAKIHWCPRCVALKHYAVIPDRPIEAIVKLGAGRPSAEGQQIPNSEPHRFEGNIELWQRKYSDKRGFSSARILQGDSRKLSEVIASADLVCSSPPYSAGLGHGGQPTRGEGRGDDRSLDAMQSGYGATLGQLGSMPEGKFSAVVSSPPFCEQQQGGGLAAVARGEKSAYPVTVDLERNGYSKDGYQCQGDTQGQLSAMPEGKFDAVVSSPPYAAIAAGAGGLNTKPGKDGQQSGRSPDSASQATDQHYGETAGQLSGMPEGKFDEYPGGLGQSSIANAQKHIPATNTGNILSLPAVDGSTVQESACVEPAPKNRPTGEGGASPDTFWESAKLIIQQCHRILRPGGHAIFVCKDFVRKGKRVPFSDHWQALCESVGFRLVCRHRAMLVAHHGEQDTIFGGIDNLTTERKSFFRRLAEKEGSPRIDHEDVICMERA